MLEDLKQCSQCETIQDKTLFFDDDTCLKCHNGDTKEEPFQELQLSSVFANPDQPRKHFDNKEIADLGQAIEKDGLLQPIVVVKKDNGYMIVSGERRFRAHLWMCAETIKAHIIKADGHNILELALIENIQRENLSDFEVAKHIGKLWASGNYANKKDLAQALGKSQSYLSKAFGCLKLDKEIIADMEEAKHDLPLSVLEEIARVKDKEIQKEVYDKYLAKKITRDGIAAHRNAESESAAEKRYTAQRKKDTFKMNYEQIKGLHTSFFFSNRKSDANYKITIQEL